MSHARQIRPQLELQENQILDDEVESFFYCMMKERDNNGDLQRKRMQGMYGNLGVQRPLEEPADWLLGALDPKGWEKGMGRPPVCHTELRYGLLFVPLGCRGGQGSAGMKQQFKIIRSW